MRVGHLREILQRTLDGLEGLPDDARIVEHPNTFTLYPPILETSTGFLDLNEPIRVEED